MADDRPSRRREFWKSAHHAALGLATLGAGVLASSPHLPWPLLVGAAAYAIGWIYFPDSEFFRRALERRYARARDAEAAREVEAFRAKSAQMLNALSPSRRERYAALLAVCRDIERATNERSAQTSEPEDPNIDLRLKKLEELAWTYLRLLSIEEAQERFLEVERRENLPREVAITEESARALESEVAALTAGGQSAKLESKQRLFQSCLERLDVLRKRAQRVEEARESLVLIASEQERLVSQVKLIRADAIATKNAEGLSNRIDATIEHLNETNRWLAGLEQYKDLVGTVPNADRRIGFDAVPSNPAAPPPIPARSRARENE